MAISSNDNNSYALEKIVEGFERNLDIQGKFFEKNNALLEELHNIKTKLEITDRFNIDLKADVEKIINNTFEFLNKMNKVSNAEIMEMLIQFKSDKGDLFTIVTNMLTQLEAIDKDLIEVKKGLLDIKIVIHDIELKTNSIEKNTDQLSKFYKILTGVMIAITLLVSAISIGFKLIDQDNMKDIKTYIDQQSKKGK